MNQSIEYSITTDCQAVLRPIKIHCYYWSRLDVQRPACSRLPATVRLIRGCNCQVEIEQHITAVQNWLLLSLANPAVEHHIYEAELTDALRDRLKIFLRTRRACAESSVGRLHAWDTTGYPRLRFDGEAARRALASQDEAICAGVLELAGNREEVRGTTLKHIHRWPAALQNFAMVRLGLHADELPLRVVRRLIGDAGLPPTYRSRLAIEFAHDHPRLGLPMLVRCGDVDQQDERQEMRTALFEMVRQSVIRPQLSLDDFRALLKAAALDSFVMAVLCEFGQLHGDKAQRLLTDCSRRVRRAAAEFLGGTGQFDSMQALKNATQDRDSRVTAVANRAIRDLSVLQEHLVSHREPHSYLRDFR